MSEPPTEEEICKVMDSLKANKASGKNGILPEMLKSRGPDTMANIHDLFSTVWREEKVPDEWRDTSSVLYGERRKYLMNGGMQC